MDKVVIFHCEYHPRGIPKHGIRRIFEETCQGISEDYRLIIAFSRPPHLRDAFIHSKLPDDNHYLVSSFLPTGTHTL